MSGIWPRRTIELERPHPMDREGPKLLGLEQAMRVWRALGSFGSQKDEPTLLHDGKQLVALIHIGTDGVGGDNALLVLVTNTADKTDSALHLEVVTYGQIAGSDKKRYMPSTASEMLDKMVKQITEELGDMVAHPIEK